MTRQQQIAASVEEVDKLLESNAKLSIAYLGLRLNQIHEDYKKNIERQEKMFAAVRKLAGQVESLADRTADNDQRIDRARDLFTQLAATVQEIKSQLDANPETDPEDSHA